MRYITSAVENPWNLPRRSIPEEFGSLFAQFQQELTLSKRVGRLRQQTLLRDRKRYRFRDYLFSAHRLCVAPDRQFVLVRSEDSFRELRFGSD